MKKGIWAGVIFVGLLGLVLGWKDDEPMSSGQLAMYLVTPLAIDDSLILVFKEVAVHSDNQGWMDVKVATQTFDHIQTETGTLSILGEATLGTGEYTHVRLLLDVGSYVMVNGRRRAVAIPDDVEAGKEFVCLFQIQADRMNTLYLDFDGNGSGCICACCAQFKSDLHIYTNLETLGNNVQRRLKASRGLERCKCADRWDHREKNGQHCRHCAPINSNVGVIG
ncbi:MAG: DUF4382 domain-containing protein [Bacteroidota bacterium]